MIKHYKYIHFEQQPDGEIFCFNSKGKYKIGYVDINEKWHCYEFVPEPNTAFTEDCLTDIADFLNKLGKPKCE